MNGLRYVRPGNGFIPSFPLLKKMNVNGAKENSVYTFLKAHCPVPGGVIMKNKDSITWSPVRSNDVTWNFEKYLIDHNGKPARRYHPSVDPRDIENDIEVLIAKCKSESGSGARRDDTGMYEEIMEEF